MNWITFFKFSFYIVVGWVVFFVILDTNSRFTGIILAQQAAIQRAELICRNTTQTASTKSNIRNPTLPIESKNRISCCSKETQRDDENVSLRDLCGGITECCTFHCKPPTAMSFGNGDELRSREDLSPTIASDNAFYFETSGATSLSVRQACGVESLAKLNPNLAIYVFMAPSEGKPIDINATTMINLLKSYDNIRVRKIHFDGFFADTQLEHWYQCTDWNDNSFAVWDLSDALRLLTLFKYGGYYFDFDYMHIKPVASLPRNFVAHENIDDNDPSFNNAALHVEHQHWFVSKAMEEFESNFRKSKWANNGPKVITRLLKKICLEEELTSLNSDGNHVIKVCKDVHLLPRSTFQPMLWGEETDESFKYDNKPIIDINHLNKTKFNQTIAVHFFEHATKNMVALKDQRDRQLYTHLAYLQCPVTYEFAPVSF